MTNALHRNRGFITLLILGLGGMMPWGAAQDLETDPEPQTLLIPYAFYNESFNVAAGVAYGVLGAPQPQAGAVGTLAVGSNGSWLLFFAAEDLKIPGIDRLYIRPMLSLSDVEDFRSYQDGNPNFPDERAGSNDSHEDNYLEGDGSDTHLRVRMKYVLPMGSARETSDKQYVLEDGLLVSGAIGEGSWNPLESGQTAIELSTFYREQDITAYGVYSDRATNGLSFALAYDNRDYPMNPSRGSFQRITYSKDFGWFDSDSPWEVVQGEFSKYFDLGATERFRQRVLAFQFWTSDTISWNDQSYSDGESVYERPPNFAGSTLGGIFRMRAYSHARFNDRAAIYYCGEYRVIPHWNPAKDLLSRMDVTIDWWQLVFFAEVGRVAERWSFSELHEDMKVDGGIGLRAMSEGIVLRADFAACEEGANVQMMIAHPF